MITPQQIVVLLIDDQPMIGEGVRRMLALHPEIDYHYCSDARKAVLTAEAVRPTVALVDLVMPEIDGLTLVRQFRGHPDLRDVPLMVLTAKEEPRLKADAFESGADDFLVKLPDRSELVARIRYHSRGYLRFLERNAAFVALGESQEALAKELRQAAEYVRSMLQPPLTGPVSTRWSFITSSRLGGDALGYQWLDDECFAVYMLDVCGHGVGAALLSVSAMNAVRTGRFLTESDRRNPAGVLDALNDMFPMERHNDMYIAVWYGVFDRTRRTMTYASGGHPPGVLIGPGGAAPAALHTGNPPIGVMAEARFESATVDVPPDSRLYLFSDGALELSVEEGDADPFARFLSVLSQPLEDAEADIQRLKTFAESKLGGAAFEDDFSILRVDFA